MVYSDSCCLVKATAVSTNSRETRISLIRAWWYLNPRPTNGLGRGPTLTGGGLSRKPRTWTCDQSGRGRGCSDSGTERRCQEGADRTGQGPRAPALLIIYPA